MKIEPWSQEYNIRGAAFGFAYGCRMMHDHPDRTEIEKDFLKWAEISFLHLAQDKITDDEAICGYGG